MTTRKGSWKASGNWEASGIWEASGNWEVSGNWCSSIFGIRLAILTRVSFGELTSGTSPGAHLEWAREVKFGTDNSSGECHRPSRLLWEDQPSAGAQTSKAEPQCHFVFLSLALLSCFYFLSLDEHLYSLWIFDFQSP